MNEQQDNLGEYLSKSIGDIISDTRKVKQENEYLKDNIAYLESCYESITQEMLYKKNCERNIILMNIISNLKYFGKRSKSKISVDLRDSFDSVIDDSINFGILNNMIKYKSGYYHATNTAYKFTKCKYIGRCKNNLDCFYIHTDLEQSVRKRLKEYSRKYIRYRPHCDDDDE